jgi:hypothetical protein
MFMNPLAIKAVAILALATGLIFGYSAWHHHVFAQGEAATQAKWDAAEKKRAEAEKAAVLKREQENEAEREKNRENNRLLQKSYDSELARLRAAIDAAPRMRVGPSFCGSTPGQAEAGGAGGSAGADTRSRVLPEEVDRAVKSLIEETEKAAATGRACQTFIKDNGLTP